MQGKGYQLRQLLDVTIDVTIDVTNVSLYRIGFTDDVTKRFPIHPNSTNVMFSLLRIGT
jgi:hypothetical protein